MMDAMDTERGVLFPLPPTDIEAWEWLDMSPENVTVYCYEYAPGLVFTISGFDLDEGKQQWNASLAVGVSWSVLSLGSKHVSGKSALMACRLVAASLAEAREAGSGPVT